MFQNFDYQTPTRVIFGKGVEEKLPEMMRPFVCRSRVDAWLVGVRDSA